jgi:hypothetical protein
VEGVPWRGISTAERGVVGVVNVVGVVGVVGVVVLKVHVGWRTHHRLGNLDTQVAERAESANREDLTNSSAPLTSLGSGSPWIALDRSGSPRPPVPA